jgi:hypothetical protein
MIQIEVTTIIIIALLSIIIGMVIGISISRPSIR